MRLIFTILLVVILKFESFSQCSNLTSISITVGAQTTCQNSVELTATLIPGATYSWSVNNMPMPRNHPNPNMLFVTVSGSYSVVALIPNCPSIGSVSSSNVSILAPSLPTPSREIESSHNNLAICKNAVSYYSYPANITLDPSVPQLLMRNVVQSEWTLSGTAQGIITNEHFDTYNYSGRIKITWQTSGTAVLTLKQKNACGEFNMKQLNIVVNDGVATTPIISGPDVICLEQAGAKAIYSISNAEPGASFTWKSPNGFSFKELSPTSIEVTFQTSRLSSYNISAIQNNANCVDLSGWKTTQLGSISPLPEITVRVSSIDYYCPRRYVLDAEYYTPPNSVYRWFRDGNLIAGENQARLITSIEGSYRVERVSLSNCIVSSESKLVSTALYPIPPFEIKLFYGTNEMNPQPTSICPTEPIKLKTNFTTNSVIWFLDGAPLRVAPEIIQPTPGTYHAEYKVGTCTYKSNALTITHKPLPAVVNVPSEFSVCTGIDLKIPLSASVPSRFSVTRNSSLSNFSSVNASTDANDILTLNLKLLPSITTPQIVEYIIKPTSNEGCVGTSQKIFITVLPSPWLTNPLVHSTCPGVPLNINLTSTIPTTFQWYANPTFYISGSSSTEKNTSVINDILDNRNSVTSAISYKVKPYSENGNCFGGWYTVTVNVFPAISTISSSQGLGLCEGSSIILKGNLDTGLTYQWKRNGEIIPNEIGINYEAKTGGTYTLITKNAYLCEKESSPVNVTENPLPNAIITPANSATICSGGNVKLEATSANNQIYQWRLNGANITAANSPVFTAFTAGNYSVYVKNTLTNCESVSNVTTVTISQRPSATIAHASSLTFCQGENVLLSANTGTGLTYQWRKDGVDIAGATGPTYLVEQSGSYTAVVKNAAGCPTISNALVATVKPLPLATISTPPTTTLCSGSSIVLNANAGTGLTYQWFREGAIVSGATQASYTVLQGGSYNVKVTNNGCTSASNNVTIVPANPLLVSISASSALCEGSSVTLTTVISNSNLPNSTAANLPPSYSYAWSTGATTPSITISTAGSYSVTVVDNLSGCSYSSSFRVFLPLRPAITASGTLCGGYVTLTSSIGNTYRWSNGATTRSINVYNSGTYTVTTTNATGCTTPSAPFTVAACSEPRDPRILQQAITTNNNLDKSRILSVYPNKADKQFNVKFSQPLNEETRVIIYNQFGFPVKQGFLSKGITEELIESTNLTEGIYVIRVFTSEGLLTQKVIISH